MCIRDRSRTSTHESLLRDALVGVAYFGGRHPDFRVRAAAIDDSMLTAVPTDVFDHSAESRAPVERVWIHLQDPQKWQAMGGIDRISDPSFGDEGHLQGFDFVSTIAGRDYRGTAVTVTADPHDRMVVDVDTNEIGARLTVDLSPADDGGTRLDVRMQVTSKTFLATMMWGLIASTVGASLPQRVQEMVAQFD